MAEDWLADSREPVAHGYDAALLDLDGVVYRGLEPLPGASEVVGRLRSDGVRVVFVTNNASRTPDSVADRLDGLGVPAAAEDVVTSAQAAAAELAARLPAGAPVLVVGGEGLRWAVRAAGLTVVSSVDAAPVAVVQGFAEDVSWHDLAEAAYAVAGGLPWVASNVDATFPTPRGLAPGNGTLVGAVAAAVGRRPDVVAGKPFRPLYAEAVRRAGAERPLVVGDRLDTDIEGALRFPLDSLLVLTGVTAVSELCRAAPDRRPSYVAWTLAGLLAPHRAPTRPPDGDRVELAGWRVGVERGELVVSARGPDQNAGLRAVVCACWAWQAAHPERSLGLEVLDRLWPGGRCRASSDDEDRIASGLPEGRT